MANRAAMAMQPICHHQTSDSGDGFSLVEVLVAVAILAILVAASARGLMTSMASDETSSQVFAGNLILNRIEAAVVRGDGVEEMQKLCGTEWAVSETFTKPSETNTISWRIISLGSAVRPSLQMKISLRVDPLPLQIDPLAERTTMPGKAESP